MNSEPLWKLFLFGLLIPLAIVAVIWIVCNALGIDIIYVALALIGGLGLAALVKKLRT